MVDVRKIWTSRIRAERKARGWDKPEMARRLAHAAGDARASLPDHETLLGYVKRWERGAVGISERYRMLYARAFGLAEEDLFGVGKEAPAVPWRALAIEFDDRVTPDDEERLSLALARPWRRDAGVIDALSTILAGERRLEDAIGPAPLLQPAVAQMATVMDMLRHASGPYRDELAVITADWTIFSGWLHAAVRQDARALALFHRAEELADDVDYGTGAALATSFRGYVARQQGRPRAVVRAASAALATPGVHLSQRTFDTLQAAQGHAALGDRDRVRRLLDTAAHLADEAGEPPPSVYWYTDGFFRLNIGMALVGVGEYRDAVEMLTEGLAGMPTEQRGAEWAREYEDALARAEERT
ncbi:transcriptional regulator [Actinoallomurus sp. NPDC052274]|uniref:transcriptional regulator n=1 Tax=Actinoallomurus sp. NPDC052274 TaxID=3155420 RepID=UPI00342BD1AB